MKDRSHVGIRLHHWLVDKCARTGCGRPPGDTLKARIRPRIVIVSSNGSETANTLAERISQICAEFNIKYLKLVSSLEIGAGTIIRSLRSISDERLRVQTKRAYLRRRHDENLAQILRENGCDVAIMVGYMQIASAALNSALRVLNLHPAPPLGPVGKWQEVIWSLISVRARTAGAMLHIVTDKLDRGPVVSYYTISLEDAEFKRLWSEFDAKAQYKSLFQIVQEEGEQEPLLMAIRARQFAREAPFIIETLRRLQDGMCSFRKLSMMFNREARALMTLWKPSWQAVSWIKRPFTPRRQIRAIHRGR